MKQARDLSDNIAQVKAWVHLEGEVRWRKMHLHGGGPRLGERCPLERHKDSTPSFNLSLDTQHPCCLDSFACEDVLDFVQDMDRCTFLAALECLAGQQIAGRGSASSNGVGRILSAPAFTRRQLQVDVGPSPAAKVAPILTRVILYSHQSRAQAPFVLDSLSPHGASPLLETRPPLPLRGSHVVVDTVDYVVTQERSLPFSHVTLLRIHASRAQMQSLLLLHRRSGRLSFLLHLDGDEGGDLGTLHFQEQMRGYPVCALLTFTQGKGLGTLTKQFYGYEQWAHTFHAIGEGGEWL